MGIWYEESKYKAQCGRCKAVLEVGTRVYQQRKGVYLCELCGSIAEHEEPEVGDVESGVIEDLKQLPNEASDRTLARSMIKTARLIDSGEVADRDIAPLLKELRTQLMQLQLAYPPEPEDDDTEKARKRRETRLLMGGELSE